MSIYISKNNQQLGPFEESKVLEMLGGGQLSPNDLAIRHGEEQWRKLGEFYPNLQNNPPAKIEIQQTAPKKSRKGLLLGCGGFFLVTLLIGGILGFLAYRNLRPADSTEDLPDVVKDFKLNDRYPPKGNIWGSEANFMGIYSNSSKTKTVLYLMTVYSSESAANEALRTDLYKSCKSGESPMYFKFVKNGTDLSQGATCAAPFYIQKGNKVVVIGGSGADVDTIVSFAENLPFNSGATMIKRESK